MHRGSCQCGAISFEVAGDLPPPDACHCSKCRKQSGHFFASTDVKRSALTVRGSDKLTWYRSSEKRLHDFQMRQERIKKALQRLGRLNQRRCRAPKTEPAISRAAQRVLAKYQVGGMD